jgi:digeranylgeranylglycerophospholipid reductase
MIDCDVLVVGAGPAGSVAALYCSKHGLDTVLIEKNDKIGKHTNTKIDSSPDYELTEIIRELDLKTENHVCNSKWHSPSGESFTLHSKIGEYYFKRSQDPDSFECSTIDKALKHGCKIFLNATIEDIKKNNGIFSEAIVLQETEKIVIKPKIIIGADGHDSFFHRHINEQIDKKKRIAHGVMGKDFVQPDISEIYFDAELAPGGYFFLITCPDGTSSAAIVLDSDKIKKPARDYFNEYTLKNQVISDKIKSTANTFAGQGALFKLDRHVYGNLVLVGDAGGLLDPLMGYGMTPAIVSAYYGSKYSVEAINIDDLETLQKYNKKVKQKFNRRSQYLFRRMFDSLDNQDFNLIIKMANELENGANINGFIHNPNIKIMSRAFFVFCKNLPGSAGLLVKSVM